MVCAKRAQAVARDEHQHREQPEECGEEGDLKRMQFRREVPNHGHPRGECDGGEEREA